MSNETLSALFLDYPNNKDSIIENIQNLITNGAIDLNLVIDGWRPIHYAASHKDEKLLQFLAEKGTKLTEKTEDGENKNIFHLILEKADCNQRFHSLVTSFLSEEEIELLNKESDSAGHRPHYYLARIPHPDLYEGINEHQFRKDNGDVFTIQFSPRILFAQIDKTNLSRYVDEATQSNNDLFLYHLYDYFPQFVSPKLDEMLGKYPEETMEEFCATTRPFIVLDSDGHKYEAVIQTLNDGTKVYLPHNLFILRMLEEEFIEAVQNRDTSMIEKISDMVDINCIFKGFNALEYAAQNEDLECCAFLIYRGVRIDPTKCPSYSQLDARKKEEITTIVNDYKINSPLKAADLLIAKTTLHEERILDESELFRSKLLKFYRTLTITKDEDNEQEKKLYTPIAQLVAFDKNVAIHIDDAKETIDRVYSRNTGLGMTRPKLNEIYIAGATSDRQTLGTIIHEFTHLACDRIWNNSTKPYAAGSIYEREMNRIVTELREAYDGDKRKEYPQILMDVFNPNNSGSYTGKEAPELIARVPEILMVHGFNDGMKMLSERTPRLLEFYKSFFLKEVEKYNEKQKDLRLSEKREQFKNKHPIESQEEDLRKKLEKLERNSFEAISTEKELEENHPAFSAKIKDFSPLQQNPKTH